MGNGATKGRWVDLETAARLTGLSPDAVKKRAHRGTIQSRVGHLRHPLWREFFVECDEAEAESVTVGSVSSAHDPTPHRPEVRDDDPDTRYYSEVDRTTRRVICYAPHWRKPKAIAFDVDAELHRAYSTQGERMSVREIATRFGWAVDTARAVLRSRGLTHASAPWPEWEQDERTDDELLDDIRAVRLQRIEAEADRRRVAELETAHKRQSRLEQWIAEVVRSRAALDTPARPVRWRLRDERPPVLAVDAMTDAHVELLSPDGTGWEEQARDVLDVTERMIGATMRAYDPEYAAILIGSDWFDADRYDGATTRGTPQRSSLPPARAVAFGLDLLRERIQRWRAACPVSLVIVPGNHDRHSTAFVEAWLRAMYGNAPDVSFLVASECRPRVYTRHGACLLGFAHGDGVRAAALPGIMADEAPDQSDVRWRYWITGDKHRHSVASMNGGEVTIAPAMSRASAWASLHFGSAWRGALTFCYHAERGLLSTIRETV